METNPLVAVNLALIDASNELEDVEGDDKPHLAAKLALIDQHIDAALQLIQELLAAPTDRPDPHAK